MGHRITLFFNWMTSLGGRANTGTQRFLRYSVAGGNTFLLDLLILWVLTEIFFVYYIFSATISYTLSTILHYYIVRSWAFKGTKRKPLAGYVLYSIILISGLLLSVGIMALFVEFFNLDVLISRIIAGLFVGVWNYALNLFVNFKTQGKPL